MEWVVEDNGVVELRQVYEGDQEDIIELENY